jgi:hypothetical protein
MNRNINKSVNKQKGYSLAEMALVLLVIIGIMLIGLIIYRQVAGSSDVVKMQSQLSSVDAAIASVYGRTYTGIASDVLIDSGKIPADMENGTVLVNSFGGTITLAAVDITGGTANGFTQTHPLVPRDVCNSVVVNSAPLYYTILVGTTVVKSPTVTPSPAVVTTACNNNVNSLVFTQTNPG